MVILGDALEVLQTMAAESVSCIVTSPPYWGLRDYGHAGQIGLEASFAHYLEKMVQVFDECKRVLRKDGTCWINMGDSYSGTGDRSPNIQSNGDMSYRAGGIGRRSPEFKSKDLIGQPWRLAFALQDAGWYLRSDIIWAKPNPMPESVKDRPTRSHEYIFLLTKSKKYWYDADAIRTETKPKSVARYGRNSSYDGSLPYSMKNAPGGTRQPVPDGWDTEERSHGKVHQNGRREGKISTPPSYNGSVPGRKDGPGQDRRSKNERSAQRTKVDLNKNYDKAEAAGELKGANARTVWTIPTSAFPGAHFATFPEEIPRRCILAGCPENGLVLDPFAGSGTTIVVANQLGRRAIGIELNPEYLALIHKRMANITPNMFLEDAKSANS